MPKIRPAVPDDFDQILALYKAVAHDGGGIARSADEISPAFITNVMQKATNAGYQFIIKTAGGKEQIVGQIHCSTPELKVFSHILTNLTIAVPPSFQGKGIDRALMMHLLEIIETSRHDILRVELISRESNNRAIALYEKLGFVKEGRLEKRIRNEAGELEADIAMVWFNKGFRSLSP